MKILLINPSIRPDNPRKIFPMGLAYIATALHKAGYEFKIYDIDAQRPTDEEVKEHFKENKYDIVAFGCIVTAYKWVKRISSLVKSSNRDTMIIAGNSVASSIPRLLLEKTDVDIAVVGEGDITVIELVRALEKSESPAAVKGIYYKQHGKILNTPKREVIQDINSIPFVNRDLFAMDKYIAASRFNIHEAVPIEIDKIRAFNVNSARGCVFKCTFCYHCFIKDKYRVRSPESIISEVKELKTKYDANYIQFSDELSFPNRTHIERFCDELEKEKLSFFWTGTIIPGVLKKSDLPLVKRMRRLGCIGLGYSIESADAKILKMMGKPAGLDKFVETRHVLREANIVTFTSLVFGYPIETEDTIKRTIDFCIEEKVAPSSGFLLALPGTWIYNYAIERGFIKDEDEYLMSIADRQDLHLNFTSISNERLVSLVHDGVRRYNSALGIELNCDNPLKTLKTRSKDSLGLDVHDEKLQ